MKTFALLHIKMKRILYSLSRFYSRVVSRYCLNLKNKGFVDTSKAIYNIADVNVSSNAWYMKWLCPLSLPLTCVFSDTGTLIDLIPGATKETFLYTTEAISDMKITNYHYPTALKFLNIMLSIC